MKDVIIILVITAIVSLAVWYVVRSKKKGKKCIGCPDSGCSCDCSKGCSGCCK